MNLILFCSVFVSHDGKRTMNAGKLNEKVLRLFIASGNEEVLSAIKALKIKLDFTPIISQIEWEILYQTKKFILDVMIDLECVDDELVWKLDYGPRRKERELHNLKVRDDINLWNCGSGFMGLDIGTVIRLFATLSGRRMQRKKGQFTSTKSSNEDSASNGSDWGPSQSWALDGTESQKPEAFEKSTPMMQRGPEGPRTLCNACGLMWENKGVLRDLSKAPPPPPAATHNLPINKIDESILEAELAGEISNSQ
ncbi:unnamed protein product [Eruca vesicaria subsp. sativa]|uniref:GATA-type domain-containing protein n=1 Tax=Eruca vesicaria subsp. sativa TaxID=29727 RepID=A0ABC8J608_ERUVS|nr:unnamed protein product [Eruca vesicaria subsp. sativa]